MKPILLVLITVFMITHSTANAWWWSEDTRDNQIKELQVKLNNQQQSTGQWQLIAFALGIGCVVVLMVGTAIGSRAKNHAKPTEQTDILEFDSPELETPAPETTKSGSRSTRSRSSAKVS